MDPIISILAICAILLLAGLACGLLDRGGFSVRWLLGGIALVALNDVLLTNFYGLLPTAFPQSEWNWQGKALALVATLAIAAHPAIGWQRVGLTFRQKKGSLKSAVPVALAYCAFFLAIAMFFPGDDSSTETIAFQLTMPSLEEESFYRGLLLFAFYEAFRGRVRVLGVDWSWAPCYPASPSAWLMPSPIPTGRSHSIRSISRSRPFRPRWPCGCDCGPAAYYCRSCFIRSGMPCR